MTPLTLPDAITELTGARVLFSDAERLHRLGRAAALPRSEESRVRSISG